MPVSRTWFSDKCKFCAGRLFATFGELLVFNRSVLVAVFLCWFPYFNATRRSFLRASYACISCLSLLQVIKVPMKNLEQHRNDSEKMYTHLARELFLATGDELPALNPIEVETFYGSQFRGGRAKAD